jgi:hypothetical protein
MRKKTKKPQSFEGCGAPSSKLEPTKKKQKRGKYHFYKSCVK